MRVPVALALASTALAQTFTSCDPTQKTCPDDKGLNSASFSTDFTTAKGNTLPQGWTAEQGTTMSFGDNGAEFTITKAGQAPTIETDFYFFFGTVSVTLKSAPGPGIISSVVLESDDLDEIDFEFFGTGQYAPTAETNFFGKGNTTSYDRATYVPVTPQPMDAFHTYTIDWNPERIIFSVDGAVIRTLAANDPLTNGGHNYPQTPMRLKLGNWAGGAPGMPDGTVEWAGGNTTYDAAPYVFYVKKVELTNLNPASSYSFTDRTGSAASIKLIKGSGSSGNLNVDGGVGPKGSSTAAAQAASASHAPSSTHTKASTTETATATATAKPTKAAHVADGANAIASGSGVASSGAKTTLSPVVAAAASGSSAAPTIGSSGDYESHNTTTAPHSQPLQQSESGASTLSTATWATVGVFTLAMCFCMV